MSTTTDVTRGRTPRRYRIARSLLATAGLVTLLAAPLAPSLAGATSTSVVISENNNGKIVTVAKGSHFTVTLHSTYWTINPVVGHNVSQVGRSVVKGSFENGTHACVPGQGCGTVTATYVANQAGLVHLRATRTTCGEALLCSKSQSHWMVVVRVR